MLVELAALRAQALIGDKRGETLPAAPTVHPAQLQRIKNPYTKAGWPAFLRSRPGEDLGLSFVPLPLKDCSKLCDAVLAKWETLKGQSSTQARQNFMDIMRSWPGYGGRLFSIEQTSVNHWPKRLNLLVSASAIAFYEPYT